MKNAETAIITSGQDIPLYSFTIEQKLSPSDATNILLDIRNRIDQMSPMHYNHINIDDGVVLYFPGRKDQQHPGDYVLSWNNKFPTHEEIAEDIINSVNRANDRLVKYKQWIELLEDVYTNGTLNIDKSTSKGEKIAKQVIFWVTLQEDINKSSHLGKLRPFCRYAEALATTQPGFIHTYDEVCARMKNPSPEHLDRWILPIEPSFYGWNAF